MALHTSSAPSRFSADHINQTIQRALSSAGLDTSAGPMRDATETIRRALSSGASPFVDEGAKVQPLDVVESVLARTSHLDRHGPSPRSDPDSLGLPGQCIDGEFTNHAGTRSYKLYVPAQPALSPRPMIVMLHGCTQSADEFARGTGMNRLAEEEGFIVLYPEQRASANMSKCWNWFQTQDQQRGEGEPAIIAGMVGQVVKAHGVDQGRIFVAGLSAGAAMAVILGETYSDIFAAVGAHSGLPFASAHDLPSAMAAMKGGRGRSGAQGLIGGNRRERSSKNPVPTIVFHGDRDHTVQYSNGAEIVRQAGAAYAAGANGTRLVASSEQGENPSGRKFSRTVHAAGDAPAHLESWTLHGAGHAWSGGDASGSYTDSNGPDASAVMVRFFLSQTSGWAA